MWGEAEGEWEQQAGEVLRQGIWGLYLGAVLRGEAISLCSV